MLIKVLTDNHKRELMFSCARYVLEEINSDAFRKRLKDGEQIVGREDYFMYGNIEKANFMRRLELYDTLKPANPVTMIYIAPGWGDQIYIMNDNGKTLAAI